VRTLPARTTAIAVLALVVLAGCGSTVEPTATQTIGPINQSLAAPGTTGTTTGTGVVTPTGPAGATPTIPPGQGGGAATLPNGTTPGTTEPGSSGTPTGTQSSSAPAQTGPISVGFVLTGTSNTAQYGASLGNTVSEHGVDLGLVNALNKKGGIDGRHIDAVFANTDTGATNWDNAFQAACATFTQDHHVSVVLGYQFTYEPDFESCLAKAGVPHLADGFNVPSNAILSAYPLFWSLDVPTIGQRNIAKFQGAIDSGVLNSKSKLGVLLDDCPGTQDAWKSQVLPFLTAHHVNLAPAASFGCPSGSNAGATSEVGEATNALLRFRSEGVNAISFVSVSEAPVLYIGSVDAQAQGYHPAWIVSSLGQLSIIGGESPIPQMQNTHGYGWLPSQDVPPAYNPKPNASQTRCLSLLHSQNVHPQSAADYGYAYNACEAVFLYADALKRDGGNANGQAISNAIGDIGSSFQSTLNLGGKSVFSNARRNDAPMVFKPINWDGGCHCFRYGHATYSMPS
jgi:hypothetical protein